MVFCSWPRVWAGPVLVRCGYFSAFGLTWPESPLPRHGFFIPGREFGPGQFLKDVGFEQSYGVVISLLELGPNK